MNMTVSPCEPGQLEQLVALWDEEFVFAKGRQQSVVERLPHVLAPGVAADVHVASVDGRAGATAVVRPFRWLTPEKAWHGAMIGLVYSRREFRGRGLASIVLNVVEEQLRQSGTDFAVLWTTIPQFYERLGWVGSDRGLFAELAGRPRSVESAPVDSRALPDADLESLEAIRTRWQSQRVERSPAVYRSVPLPATTVSAYVHNGGRDARGYALVGSAGRVGYVYEIIGSPLSFPHLWHAIHGDFDRINVNGHRGSSASEWLENVVGLTWRPQKLTMWLPLLRDTSLPFSDWFIPYFDRI
jgi:GNAT superfamily N-acetyltransferase